MPEGSQLDRQRQPVQPLAIASTTGRTSWRAGGVGTQVEQGRGIVAIEASKIERLLAGDVDEAARGDEHLEPGASSASPRLAARAVGSEPGS